jgi:hypothetical protein
MIGYGEEDRVKKMRRKKNIFIDKISTTIYYYYPFFIQKPKHFNGFVYKS